MQIAARQRRSIQRFDRHQQQLQTPKPKESQPQCQDQDLQEAVDILENPHCVGGMSARWAVMAHDYLHPPSCRPPSAGSASSVRLSRSSLPGSGSGGQITRVVRLDQQPPKPPALPQLPLGPGSGKSGSGSGATTAAVAATELRGKPDSDSHARSRTPPSFSPPSWHYQQTTEQKSRVGDRQDPVKVFTELRINEMVDESAFQAGSLGTMSLRQFTMTIAHRCFMK